MLLRIQLIVGLALWLTGCVPKGAELERRAKLLERDTTTSSHADHLRTHYADARRDESYYAYTAISMGVALVHGYKKVLSELPPAKDSGAVASAAADDEAPTNQGSTEGSENAPAPDGDTETGDVETADENTSGQEGSTGDATKEERALANVSTGEPEKAESPAKPAAQPDEKLLETMSKFKGSLMVQLALYSDHWSTAIEQNVRYPSMHVDFSTALEITKYELTRVGAIPLIDEVKDRLKKALPEDRVKYAKTIELYGVLSQLMKLAKDPDGSLRTFNETVSDLKSEFEKAYSVAELEY